MLNPGDTIPEKVLRNVLVSRPIRSNVYWVVAGGDTQLMFLINSWLDGFSGSRLYKRTVSKYYRNYTRTGAGNSSGAVSPFDDLLKKYSAKTGIDWLLLASLMYQESQYYVGAENKGAKGLMQVSEVTAAKYGVTDIFSPEGNIKAGSYHLRYLMDNYREEGLYFKATWKAV